MAATANATIEPLVLKGSAYERGLLHGETLSSANIAPPSDASLLKRPRSRKQVENILAAELGVSREEFWSQANQAVTAHFQDTI